MNPLSASDKQSVDACRHTVSELFHRLNKVLPDNQQVITISPETKVSQALELMLKSGFSQLPVVEGDEILGVFSYRSFCVKLSKTKNLRADPGELLVDEFIEQLEFARVTDEFRSVFKHLNRNDAVLVGEPNRLQGVVTAMLV